MEHRSPKLKIFIGLMLSYVLVLVIPLGLFSLSYLVVIKNINADVMKVTKEQQNWGIAMLEWKLQELQKMAFQLTTNLEVLNFLDKTGRATVELYEAKRISVVLRNAVMMNNLIKKCYIYFPKSNTVVNQDSIFNYHDFYSYFFHYQQFEQEQWRQQYLNAYTDGEFIPKSKMFFDDREETGILYLKTIGTPNQIKAAIVMLVDNSEIARLSSSITEKYNGWSYIQNGKGQVIFSTREDNPGKWLYNRKKLGSTGIKRLRTKQGNYTVIVDQSSFNDWQYVNVLDSNRVFLRSNRIMRAIIWFILVVSGIGMTLVFLITFKRFKPVDTIFSRIKEHLYDIPEANNKDIYEVIEGGVHKLTDQNIELKSLIEQQKGLLKVHFYERLIAGEYPSLETLASEGERIGIIFPAGVHYIGLVRLEPNLSIDDERIQTYNAILEAVENKLISLVSDGEFVLRKGFEHFVLLLNAESTATAVENSKTRLQTIKKALSGLFPEENWYFLSLAAGNAYESIMEIPRSYHEANEVLAYKSLTPTYNLLLYSEMPAGQNIFYYPTELEIDLIRYVRTANVPVVHSIIDRIFDENLVKRNLPLNMLRYLKNELCGTALRLIEQINSEENERTASLKNQILSFLKEDNSAENLLGLKEIFEAISNEFAQHKKSHNSQLRDGVLDYLQNHYSCSDLSLTKLADLFNINENYLSNFFKEQTGVNYSDFLESLRIKNACKLLEEKHYSISDLAELVGYTNHYTFRRAFKRVTGCAPSDYRKNLK